MNRPILNDKSEYPNDKVLLRHLGKTKAIWDLFVTQISSSFPLMDLEWNFYNDGKSWLCKLIHKKKTVCCISTWENYFKTTFYFTDKNNKDINNLKIDQELKDNYRSDKSIGKLKPLMIKVKTKKALSNVFELIKYKSK
jgi:Protein of unknown function (DUF3788)